MFQKQKINIDGILPVNQSGSANDSFTDKVMNSAEEAERYFDVLIEKLNSVSQWRKYAGSDSFVFELTDKGGSLKDDPPQISDKIRIKLPGPKDGEGLGYDWVEVVRIERGKSNHTEFYLLEVSPCDCPYQSGNKTAHFYWEKSTNSFVIARQQNAVQVSIHGRNEVPNTEDQSLLDTIRNYVMAKGGIIAGSKIQWEIFTDNLMDNQDEQL